ncbi:MAG: hypothetical protein CVU18_09980 [Betaproteobacteria bacterium HGW-Betaproteobacteria-12]|nr:MAG: hypothetical protein CVU18_09980 [Betaproteobacteria bacterium HGW-Betaproteobacteria-12]
MTTTLTLLIPSDWPQQRRDCHWLLHAGDGRVLSRGCSEPAHWPGIGAADGEARRCDLLLAGRQVAGHVGRLPKNRLTQEVAAAALEEQLLDAPEQLLFAIGPAAADGSCTVGVIARQRLEGLLGVLRELGLEVRSAWPLGLALPPGHGWLLGGELNLALPEHGFVALPVADDWLSGLPASATPLAIALPETPTPDIRRALDLAESTGRLCCGAPDNAPPAPAGPGFLVGPLAPPTRRLALLRPFLPAARLAAGLLLGGLLLAAAQWGWHAWQVRTYRQEIASTFRQIQPQAAMVDPLLQLQRQVDALRRRNGQLADDDFLRLADALSALPAGSIEIQEMQFAGGRLELAARLADDGIERLQAAASQRGLSLQVTENSGSGDQRSTKLLLSRGGTQ